MAGDCSAPPGQPTRALTEEAGCGGAHLATGKWGQEDSGSSLLASQPRLTGGNQVSVRDCLKKQGGGRVQGIAGGRLQTQIICKSKECFLIFQHAQGVIHLNKMATTPRGACTAKRSFRDSQVIL